MQINEKIVIEIMACELMHPLPYSVLYCVRYTCYFFIQVRVCNMSILQCMQFCSSYDEESYNEHEFMYHDFYTIV